MEPTLQVVIPSRLRTHLIGHAISFFDDPIVCVDESEVDAYRRVIPTTRLLAHPPEVNILPKIRQWIMDHVEADVIVQVDDDVHDVVSLVGERTRSYHQPADVMAILWNAARNCREAGTIMFTFAAIASPVHFPPFRPFRFVMNVVGNVMGFWREEFNQHIQFDPRFHRASLDVALRVLYRYRILWGDLRFCFAPGPHMVQAGGLAGTRTQETIEHDDQLMQARYGTAVTIRHPQAHGKARGFASKHVILNIKR